MKINGQNNPLQREKLVLPHEHNKLLLHTCCAPCSGEIIAALQESNINFTIFYYNPNIHPQQEYLIRKEENIRYAKEHGIPFVDADYDPENWFERTKGLEHTPERGARCTICFDIRLERAALYAHENGFYVLATSLGISRWKDMQQVYGCGQKAVNRYPHLIFWDYNWRKKGGSQRMIEISREEHFYQQEYCGCVYSLRDANQWRKEQGRDPIHRGDKFYGVDKEGKS